MNIEDLEYNIFGSGNSLDYDIAVKTNYLGTKEENKGLILEIEKYLRTIYTTKPLNANLVVVNNNIITSSHKGTSDEVNNSILRTYSLHKQEHNCFVNRMLKRNVELKIMRAIRTILSFCSHTNNREDIKYALKSLFIEQYSVMCEIDFEKVFIEGLGNSKNVTMDHFLKKSAFQIIQVLGLIIDNFEYYTKQEMVDAYPRIAPILYGETPTHKDISYLDDLNHLMLTTVKHFYLSEIGSKKESDYSY